MSAAAATICTDDDVMKCAYVRPRLSATAWRLFAIEYVVQKRIQDCAQHMIQVSLENLIRCWHTIYLADR